MSCNITYDFLNYPSVRFPIGGEVGAQCREKWDILRPNKKAEDLIAEHLRVLTLANAEVPSKTLQ
jgi:hypothetical protein